MWICSRIAEILVWIFQHCTQDLKMGQDRSQGHQSVRGSSVDAGLGRKRWSLAESVEQVVTQYKLCQSLLELSKLPCWVQPKAVEALSNTELPLVGGTLGRQKRSASSVTITNAGPVWKSADHLNILRGSTQLTSSPPRSPTRSPSRSPARSPRRLPQKSPNGYRRTSRSESPRRPLDQARDAGGQDAEDGEERPSRSRLPAFRVHQKRTQGSPHYRTPHQPPSQQQQQLPPRGVFTPRPSTINTPSDPSSVQVTQPFQAQPRSKSPSKRSTKGLHEPKEVTMLAKATKALQEHVKDMTEKTRSTCCVGKPSNGMKENVLIQNQINNADPTHYIQDKINGNTYVRGKLLGKGGFAKCYELTCVRTGKTYAGKIISKTRLTKPHQRVKIKREVELHRPLKNSNVVQFHNYFEDDENVYFVLEICSRKSLVHVLRNRKTLTEPEVRFYMRQLVRGLRFIHDEKIIHRDLKLGNMLLNDNMHVKLADFGLATRVEYDGEKKMTVCGTPNYIAPEVLQKKGHSYEADVWAMGCIMYAMLVGRPPFETTTLKETYSRITANKYSVPAHISLPAKSLIQKLLNGEPSHRPKLEEVLDHEFFTMGYTPKTLSAACCETMPKFTYTGSSSANRPKSYASPVSTGEAMFKIQSSLAMLKLPKTRSVASAPQTITKSSGDLSPSRGSSSVLSSSSGRGSVRSAVSPVAASKSEPNVQHAGARESETAALPIGSAIRLYQMLATCMEQMPADSNPAPVHGVQPLWVTKWVDYSNKYGFGFQLSDKSVGVLFNDTTRMLLSLDGATIQYNDLSNKIYTFSSDDVPRPYSKKSTLLLYFAHYMNEHLIHGGDILQHEKGQVNLPPPVFMKKWFRTGKAIVMYLNNGTLQVNFFEDHTKVILSPEGQDYLVTFINTHRQAVTYRLLQLRHFGCHPNIAQRLDYARTMMDSIINISGEAV